MKDVSWRIGIIFILCGVLALAACFLYQAGLFLKRGEWVPISLFDALLWADRGSALSLGNNWLGIAKILDFINAGIGALLAGSLIGWGLFSASEE